MNQNTHARMGISDNVRMAAAVRQATFALRIRDTTDRFPGRSRHKKASPHRRRHPNIDVKIVEHVQSLAKHSVAPLLCASLPAGATPLVGPYKYTVDPLGTVRNLTDQQSERHFKLKAYAAASANDLFGTERTQHVVVPAWEDSLDGVKAIALAAVGHAMDGLPATVKLHARVIGAALSAKSGAATYLRERIGKKLAGHGLQGRDWFFAIESTPDRRLHLHGVIVPHKAGTERGVEIEQWRAALKEVGGHLDPRGRPVQFTAWGTVAMGWGAYCSKHRLATQSHLGESDSRRSATLLATNSMRSRARQWYEHERDANAKPL